MCIYIYIYLVITLNTIFLWLFQLDDSKPLLGKWLEIGKHPFKTGCLGFQVYIYICVYITVSYHLRFRWEPFPIHKKPRFVAPLAIAKALHHLMQHSIRTNFASGDPPGNESLVTYPTGKREVWNIDSLKHALSPRRILLMVQKSQGGNPKANHFWYVFETLQIMGIDYLHLNWFSRQRTINSVLAPWSLNWIPLQPSTTFHPGPTKSTHRGEC